jgi:hypothetical protein
MLRKLRNKEQCSFIQVILLMAMMLFLALPQSCKSVSVYSSFDSHEAEYQDEFIALTYEEGF